MGVPRPGWVSNSALPPADLLVANRMIIPLKLAGTHAKSFNPSKDGPKSGFGDLFVVGVTEWAIKRIIAILKVE